jgi:hypothetical protein
VKIVVGRGILDRKWPGWGGVHAFVRRWRPNWNLREIYFLPYGTFLNFCCLILTYLLLFLLFFLSSFFRVKRPFFLLSFFYGIIDSIPERGISEDIPSDGRV